MPQNSTETADGTDRHRTDESLMSQIVLPRQGTGPQTPSFAEGGVSRRSLLHLALAGAGVLASGPALAKTGLIGGQSGAAQQALTPGVISASAPMKGPSVPKFRRETLLMPQIQPVRTVTETVLGKSATVKYYDVTQKIGSADLLPSPFPRTEIWGYNGIYPGPLFRQTENGAYTVVSQTNELPNPTSTHLHSAPTQPAHDGHPDDLTYKKGTAPPGKLSEFDGGAVYDGTHVYRYPNRPEARTLWYHDHAMHQTAENVYKGLVGMFIQDPDAARIAKFGLDKLPKGKYDVPMVIADMQFNQDGTVAYDDKGHDSLWGNVILVNGRAWPKMTVDRTRYRFRILVADMRRAGRTSSTSARTRPSNWSCVSPRPTGSTRPSRSRGTTSCTATTSSTRTTT